MKLIHRHDEKIQAIEELTKKLEASPAFTAFYKEEAEKTLKNRKTAADRIAVLQKEPHKSRLKGCIKKISWSKPSASFPLKPINSGVNTGLESDSPEVPLISKGSSE